MDVFSITAINDDGIAPQPMGYVLSVFSGR